MSDSTDSTDSTDHPEQRAFRVLLVCHAAYCRSPLAEHILRQEAGLRQLPWEVVSAGTHAVAGRPMHASVKAILTRRGIDTGGWVSRSLEPGLVEAADLVLTAGDEQRAIVARLSPSALARTFTLLQYAYLARAADLPRRISPMDYGEVLLSSVREARGRVQPMPRSERELLDPMGQSLLKFRRCSQLVEQAVTDVTAGVPYQQWHWSTSETG